MTNDFNINWNKIIVRKEIDFISLFIGNVISSKLYLYIEWQ
jgi:hypothetical protein